MENKIYKFKTLFLGNEVGIEFSTNQYGACSKSVSGHYFTQIEIALMLHSGIIEEVIPEEWPKNGDKFFCLMDGGNVKWAYFDPNFHSDVVAFRNCFRTEKEAIEARDKIKELLISLKK